ncbi:MAG: SUMF1/EgtB/PvdO family nonheme iron enzyme, partial [Aeoliella sp.]
MALPLLLGPLVWRVQQKDSVDRVPPAVEIQVRDGMARLPTGSFRMGSHDTTYADQRPVHRVALDGFWLDTHPITNEQFAEFVKLTEYETTAEQRGSSLVFYRNSGKWQEVTGASWRHPRGPDDSLVGKDQY